MKVKELQELINSCDPEQDVLFAIQDGCCGDTMPLEIWDFERFTYKSCNYPIITFKPLPGYRSCIQSGGTKRSDTEYWKDKKPE
jgi:hypothetical protein